MVPPFKAGLELLSGVECMDWFILKAGAGPSVFLASDRRHGEGDGDRQEGSRFAPGDIVLQRFYLEAPDWKREPIQRLALTT